MARQSSSTLAVTVFYCIVCCISYTTSNVGQTYWLVTGTGISLYGQFIFFLCSLVIVSFIILSLHAFREGDIQILLPDHELEERRFFFCILCSNTRSNKKRYELEDNIDEVFIIKKKNEEKEEVKEEKHDLIDGDSYFSLNTKNESVFINTKTLPFALTWSRISQCELLFLMGLCNAFASILQWYSTPPNREPPLLNSIIPSLAVVFSVPLSKYILGDKKIYLSIAPICAFISITLGLIVGLIPTFLAGSTGLGGSESSQDIFLWTCVNVISQIPSAASLVFAQSFILRASRAGDKKSTAVLRYVAYNQLGVAVGVLFMWFLDIIPWFGSGETLQEMASEIQFAFSCSILGSEAGNGCTSIVPIWAALGVLPYPAYLSSVAALSSESAVFGNIVLVAQATIQSIFFLIPGTNPDGSATPLWSTLISVFLAIGGVALYKLWEMKQDDEDGGTTFAFVKAFRED
jgi:hypothetical protein